VDKAGVIRFQEESGTRRDRKSVV